jgi:hypothetical protein
MMNTNTSKIARPGAGRLQWESSGWFGGVAGGSSWLAFGAVALAWNGQTFAAIVSAGSWLLVLALSSFLWSRCDRVAPFHALALVLLALSLVMPIVWFIAWDVPIAQRVPSLHWIRGFRTAAACSIAPVILLCFYIDERFIATQSRDSAEQHQIGG